MFASEGIVLGLLVVAGVFLLYRTTLRENRLRLEQERFLTGATHHLKTPLTTVRLGIESMIAGTMPAEKRDHYLQAMIREIDHLEKDLTNLLTAGGLEASGRGLHLVPGDLAEDVAESADSMRDRFDTAGITLCLDIEDQVPVLRDREAIHLILHNMLDNAVKYSNKGDRVWLSLGRENHSAVLRVRDGGSGISPDELSRVFDRFYRGSGNNPRGGSGIGLFLVSELVETHGGTVAAKSEGQGKGTEFTIRIPLLSTPGTGGGT
jgi:two-component system CheB/CheR fusion protein